MSSPKHWDDDLGVDVIQSSYAIEVHREKGCSGGASVCDGQAVGLGANASARHVESVKLERV